MALTFDTSIYVLMNNTHKQRTTTEDVESIVKHNNVEMAARINTAKNVLEQQVNRWVSSSCPSVKPSG